MEEEDSSEDWEGEYGLRTEPHSFTASHLAHQDPGISTRAHISYIRAHIYTTTYIRGHTYTRAHIYEETYTTISTRAHLYGDDGTGIRLWPRAPRHILVV